MEELSTLWGYLLRMFSGLKVAAALLAGLAGAYWSGSCEALRGLLVGLLALFVTDFITGIAATVKEHGWGHVRSRIMIRSAYKMMAYGGSLGAAWGIDVAVRAGDAAQLAIALLACLTEAKSVAENSARLGFPWPQAIIRRIDEWEQQVQQHGDVQPRGGMAVTDGEEEYDDGAQQAGNAR